MSILAVIIQLVHSSDKKKIIESLYEWKTKFKSVHHVPRLIPWNDTFLRITHTVIEKSDSWDSPDYVLQDNYSLYINTVDPKYNNTVNCKIPNDYCWGDDLTSAVSLGNGKIVVLYGWKRQVSVINVTTCAEVTFYSYVTNSSIIVPGYDTFDVITYSDQCNDTCILRYSDEGKMLQGLHNKRKIEKIHKLRSPSGRYYGVNKLPNTCSEKVCTLEKLMIMNSGYDVVREYNLQQHTEFQSFDHGNLTVCYRNYQKDKNQHMLECKLMDSDFNVMANASFKVVKEIGKGSVAVHNLMGGGAVVLYKDSNPNSDEEKVLYRRIHADGKYNDTEIVLFTVPKYRIFNVYLDEKNAIENVYCGMMLFSDHLVGKCFKAV